MTLQLAYDPASPGNTRALLREIGAEPNRTLGQNFLVNRSILDRIVAAAAIGPADCVLEVGPGLGALTCRLVANAARVAAIEKDPQMARLLQRHLPVANLRLIEGDALKVAWAEVGLPATGVKVAANLPYSISKPMLRRILEEWRPHFTTATVMVQREVADRLVAPAGDSAYGPMALMTQLHATAKRMFDIGPGSFLPPPAVTSSVVHIVMRPEPAVALVDENLFWFVVRAAFGQRRKQLANTLRCVVADKDRLAALLCDRGIDPRRRGETLSLLEFAALANTLAVTPR